MSELKIGGKLVGDNHPTYFIADISANHDADLQRAIDLIYLAKDSGADCAKFQHFHQDWIASDYGFQKVGQLSHQAGWKESPYEVFKKFSIPPTWTPILARHCQAAGIEFMSTPYDIGAVDHLDPYVNAFKIGSGDITYIPLIKHIVTKNKPIIIASGAADFWDVARAMRAISTPVCLMQCNTNYTYDPGNHDHINLRVLPEYKHVFPQAVIGLSDHMTSMANVLGAVALGARIIERHFTDNSARTGPDHGFSMIPEEWEHMVKEVRLLERALGRPTKVVESNERETVVLQRRCLRAAGNLAAGTVLTEANVAALRPAPEGSMPPYLLKNILGKQLTRDLVHGEEIHESDIR